ncbi:MFS transporter [Geodermatophilus sp. URMC 63]
MKRPLRSPVGRGGALVVPGLLVIAVTYGLARYGFGLHLPRFRSDLGLSTGSAGAIAAGSYLAYCVAAVLGVRLVARGRARQALWVAGGSAAIGSVVVASSWTGPVLAAGVLVAGAGAGAATPALVAAVAATVPPSVGARAQAVVNSGTGAGVVVGGLVVLAWPAQWRGAWLGYAVGALLATWWADHAATWPSPAAAPEPPDPGGRLLRHARPLAASLLAGAGGAAVWTFGRDLVTESGLGPQATGVLWCLLGAAALLGGLSGGLVERAGLGTAWVVSVGVTAGGTTLLSWRPGSAPVAAAALAVFGCGFVALSGVLIAWGAQLTPGSPARAAALLFIALTAGQAAGALGVGALADATTTRAAFLAAAGLLLAAAVTAPPLAPPPAGPRDPRGVPAVRHVLPRPRPATEDLTRPPLRRHGRPSCPGPPR